MGRFILASGSAVALAAVIGVAVQLGREPAAEPVAYVETSTIEAIEASEPLEIGSTGSALATAAFGLSALQPETFNSQIVLDIIEASPLAYGEKDRLTAKLMAAEAGNAELPSVLSDIRTSLAVE